MSNETIENIRKNMCRKDINQKSIFVYLYCRIFRNILPEGGPECNWQPSDRLKPIYTMFS